MSVRATVFTVCWLAIALLVMGMDGCPQSQAPLSSREEGFVDPSITGIWQGTQAENLLQQILGEGVTLADNVYEARIDPSGGLKVRQYGTDGEVEVVFSGYTSLLDGRRYLNLKISECPLCEEAMYELDAPTCPYMIVQYAPELPRRLIGTDVAKVPDTDGRVLYVGMMDEDFVASAIDEGRLDSDPGCIACIWEGSCISSNQEELRRFVSRYDAELYPSINWDIYVELPSVPILEDEEETDEELE